MLDPRVISDGLVIGRYRNRAEEIGHRDAQKNHYGGSYEDGGYFEFLCQWRLLGVRAGRSRLSQIGPHVLHHRFDHASGASQPVSAGNATRSPPAFPVNFVASMKGKPLRKMFFR